MPLQWKFVIEKYFCTTLEATCNGNLILRYTSAFSSEMSYMFSWNLPSPICALLFLSVSSRAILLCIILHTRPTPTLPIQSFLQLGNSMCAPFPSLRSDTANSALQRPPPPLIPEPSISNFPFSLLDITNSGAKTCLRFLR